MNTSANESAPVAMDSPRFLKHPVCQPPRQRAHCPCGVASRDARTGEEIKASRKRLLFELFFLSGFCGLLYQVVWVRLAFASFGITTPVLSVVISIFMVGLAVGSWAAGRWGEALARTAKMSPIHLYAAAELLIGAGAFLVPMLFALGESSLANQGESNSAAYLALSAIAIALSILPWCIAMGATYPLVMAYVRTEDGGDAASFSHLYLANVLGASAGALVTACVLVEVLGFRHTLWLAGGANVLIATAALLMGLQSKPAPATSHAARVPPSGEAVIPERRVNAILFITGLASLAMEVVWTRAFSPVLGTKVYAFAALLAAYLVGTWIGSIVYRRHLAVGRVRTTGGLLLAVALFALMPVVLNDPRLFADERLRAVVALASILPLCAALGYLTPGLIDRASGGDPRIAGRAYALNVIGCILGPLIASYMLLPLLGAAYSLVLLSVPLLGFAWVYRDELSPRVRGLGTATAAALLVWSVAISVSYEIPCAPEAGRCEVRRDYAATVVARGEGMRRDLVVNGVGITILSPITKYMAHLPLAFHQGRAESTLVICFGMGTSYRSLLSWGVRATAVELVPSVRDSFGYFHADAAAILASPRGRVVIDDGRRFLERTQESYDVIVVDPPPPVPAAGSSLLYSREFHEEVRRHLKPGGVFQTWWPGGEELALRAIARSLADVFPHVRVYRSVDGWGLHFLASMQPIPDLDADRLLAHMPASARADLTEWTARDVKQDLEVMLESELPIARVLPAHATTTITDDRAFNEYYLVRRVMGGVR